jgi:DNA topoisomerase IB
MPLLRDIKDVQHGRIIVNDSDFVESDHPRDENGMFSEKGSAKVKKTPTDLTIEDLDENSKKKYKRIESLRKQFNSVWKENALAVNKDERAACLSLIMKTGIRPGSDKDTNAKVKAYGATTLEGRHVVEENGKVFLRYVGKKGVNLNIPVPDREIADMLLSRKKTAGADGRLFKTNAEKLLEYSHSLDGGEFKTKDFRTHVGTKTAIEMIKKHSTPKNFKEYKKAVMAVAKEVSSKLGNTPVVALQAYIDPRVFSDWRKEVAS